jgi:hypothetical protein
VVVFVHDNFERAARAQAVGLRLPDLRIYVYEQYKPGNSATRESEKAVEAAKGFQELLRAER